MRITSDGRQAGILPIRAAQAYGVKPAGFGGQKIDAAAHQLDSPPPVAGAVGVSSRADSYDPAKAVDGLVAAKVPQRVNFDAPSRPTGSVPSAHVLQMYARAADRVEAAVGVRLGQSVDLRG